MTHVLPPNAGNAASTPRGSLLQHSFKHISTPRAAYSDRSRSWPTVTHMHIKATVVHTDTLAVNPSVSQMPMHSAVTAVT
jgi:hypothetical protein